MATKRKSKTKTKTKRKSSLRGFKLPTAKKLKSAFNRVGKRTLVECTMTLWRAAPKRVKISVAVKLEKALARKPKTRKAKKRTTKRKARRR